MKQQKFLLSIKQSRFLIQKSLYHKVHQATNELKVHQTQTYIFRLTMRTKIKSPLNHNKLRLRTPIRS